MTPSILSTSAERSSRGGQAGDSLPNSRAGRSSIAAAFAPQDELAQDRPSRVRELSVSRGRQTIRKLVTTLCLSVPLLHGAAIAGPDSRPIRTGQTTCWGSNGIPLACLGTGQDGDLRRGEPRGYIDNGDGTVRDKRTGLTWEKLGSDLSVHDRDATYTWNGAFSKIAALNSASFAGYSDWRLPNVVELQSLVNFGATYPAVSEAFDNGCVVGCSVLNCSCTVQFKYWSSTTSANTPQTAWAVSFDIGNTTEVGKNAVDLYVRAVRGGRR